MAILKSEIKNKYSTIPNEIIRDKTLSHSEYRLLIYLYSLPDNWKINQGYLASELNTTRNKINQRLSNIKKLGFLDIKKNTNLEEIDVDYLYILKNFSVKRFFLFWGAISKENSTFVIKYYTHEIFY